MIEAKIAKIWEHSGGIKNRNAKEDFNRVMTNSIEITDNGEFYLGTQLILARDSYLLISRHLAEAMLSNNNYIREMAHIILGRTDVD